MKSKYIYTFLVGISSLFITGCDQTSSMLGGSAIGTAAGAGLGYAIDGGAGGAILGGVIGGLAGAAIGSEDASNGEYCQVSEPKTVCQTRMVVHHHDSYGERQALRRERECLRREREALEYERRCQPVVRECYYYYD